MPRPAASACVARSRRSGARRAHNPHVDGVTQTDRANLERALDELAARERQLARSELRYRLAATGGHVWDWDIVHGTADYPTSFWQRCGLSAPPDDQAAQVLESRMHPDDRARWRAAISAHLREHKPYDLVFRMRIGDGSWRWFQTQGQAVWDDQGRAVYMAGTTFDVTERQLAGQALLRTQSELSDLTQRLLGQERQFMTRIALALHDRVGQALGSARLHLDLALRHAGALAPQDAARLQRASAQLDVAVAEVRQLLVDLRPPLLIEQGLAAALDNELRRGAVAGLEVDVRLHASPTAGRARWPDAVEYAAFMIAREALSNALRHAGATQVRLQLDGDAGRLELAIEDDGRGIAESDRHGRPGHLGLVGMRERALKIGARLLVAPRAAGGTRVHLAWEAQAGEAGAP